MPCGQKHYGQALWSEARQHYTEYRKYCENHCCGELTGVGAVVADEVHVCIVAAGGADTAKLEARACRKSRLRAAALRSREDNWDACGARLVLVLLHT